MNHHDGLFKALFSERAAAEAHFREVLPPPLVSDLRLDELELQPTEFLDQLFDERRADLLYSIPLGTECDPFLIYVLFEHQSSIDPRMAWRVLGYIVLVLGAWAKANPEDSRTPFVFPLVLYQGERRWSAPIQFAETVTIPDHLRPCLKPYTVDFRYELESISREPPDSLPGGSVERLCLQLLAARSDADRLEAIRARSDALDDTLRDGEGWRLRVLHAALRYLLLTADDISPNDLEEELMNANPDAASLALTTGERLIEQGIEQGVAAATRKFVLRSLARGVTVSEVAEFFGLSEAEVRRIESTSAE